MKDKITEDMLEKAEPKKPKWFLFKMFIGINLVWCLIPFTFISFLIYGSFDNVPNAHHPIKETIVLESIFYVMFLLFFFVIAMNGTGVSLIPKGKK